MQSSGRAEVPTVRRVNLHASDARQPSNNASARLMQRPSLRSKVFARRAGLRSTACHGHPLNRLLHGLDTILMSSILLDIRIVGPARARALHHAHVAVLSASDHFRNAPLPTMVVMLRARRLCAPWPGSHVRSHL